MSIEGRDLLWVDDSDSDCSLVFVAVSLTDPLFDTMNDGFDENESLFVSSKVGGLCSDLPLEKERKDLK